MAAWGSVGHHQSGGSAFALNGLEVMIYFLRGLPLGDAVWFNESQNSGLLYGDPLYSPVAVRVNPVNAFDTLTGVTDLFGSTVNGRDPARVLTNYQVDFCPGDDFFVCDQTQSWSSTGINGAGGNVDQLLGSWDSSSLAPGTYVLRLAVTSVNRITGRSQTLNDYYPVVIAPAPADPVPPAGSLQLSAPTYNVAENGLTASIIVTRDGGSFGAVSVDYTTSDGSATAGSDYTAVSGTLAFADGVLSQIISIDILDDLVSEGDEFLLVALGNPAGGTGIGANMTATLTITDDDSVTQGLADTGAGGPIIPALWLLLVLSRLCSRWKFYAREMSVSIWAGSQAGSAR